MEDGIEKVNPVNTGIEIKISEENRIKYKRTTGRRKTCGFNEIFGQKTEKQEKDGKKSHAKYKNGRRIK